ncbi:hypothetical protein G4B88_029456 [Cannabis sativa]|uniref:DNA mismatch repair proteins mutS family domain-containing protein n=1 Tax=Cannabis sativa TaxID=3483 RepID=A0A7J6HBM5_CANSA|nr:hypothetical protein G4B88_029456 [Cannabis sativa]
MDELGRATSSIDGFAIAWSCCEYLLSLKAFLLQRHHKCDIELQASLCLRTPINQLLEIPRPLNPAQPFSNFCYNISGVDTVHEHMIVIFDYKPDSEDEKKSISYLVRAPVFPAAIFGGWPPIS